NLSGEDILNKIEKDAGNSENEPDEEPDMLQRLGLSKKDKQKKEMKDLKQKNEELHDKYVRIYAEFENYKKRTQKERIEFFRTAGIDVITSLLPILDDFDRAMKQMENSKDINAIKEGEKLIHQKLTGIMESKGLKRMKSIGEVFNPEFHDAVTEIPVNDEQMKGKVVEEIEPGYFLNDKIIRHAKVVVGK